MTVTPGQTDRQTRQDKVEESIKNSKHCEQAVILATLASQKLGKAGIAPENKNNLHCIYTP